MIPTQQEIEDYVMPTIHVGSPVLWYPTGLKNSRPPIVVFVNRAFHRTVNISKIRGGGETAVRHVSDPKLQLNSEQRQSGAWDFTEERLQYEAERRDILDRLVTLESKVPKDSAKKAGTETRRYQELRRLAVSAGIPVSGNPPKEWLIAELDKLDPETTLKE